MPMLVPGDHRGPARRRPEVDDTGFDSGRGNRRRGKPFRCRDIVLKRGPAFNGAVIPSHLRMNARRRKMSCAAGGEELSGIEARRKMTTSAAPPDHLGRPRRRRRRSGRGDAGASAVPDTEMRSRGASLPASGRG